jgi:8-oxo-dGTP diphosphatase
MKHYIEQKTGGEIVLVNDVVATSVATLVMRNKQLMLGRRYENNQFCGWQCPGGYLRKGETICDAASRLCLKKAGIKIENLSPGPYSNNIFSGQLHTTTLYIIADDYKVENRNAFESVQAQWSWFDVETLPEPLFLPLKMIFDTANNDTKSVQ